MAWKQASGLILSLKSNSPCVSLCYDSPEWGFDFMGEEYMSYNEDLKNLSTRTGLNLNCDAKRDKEWDTLGQKMVLAYAGIHQEGHFSLGDIHKIPPQYLQALGRLAAQKSSRDVNLLDWTDFVSKHFAPLSEAEQKALRKKVLISLNSFKEEAVSSKYLKRWFEGMQPQNWLDAYLIQEIVMREVTPNDLPSINDLKGVLVSKVKGIVEDKDVRKRWKTRFPTMGKSLESIIKAEGEATPDMVVYLMQHLIPEIRKVNNE